MIEGEQMRIAIFSIMAIIAFSICPASRADDNKAAKAAFKEGTVLFHEGQYEEAALKFRKANTLNPNWKLLYNIGQSEAAAKRHGLALQAFEEYLSEGGDDIGEPRRSELAEEISRLRGIVGEVSVKAPDGALIFVNGRRRGTAPLPGSIPVPAGKLNIIKIEQDGEIILEREVRVGSGRSIKVDALASQASELQPNDQPQADEKQASGEAGVVPTDSPKTPDKLKIGGWILIGVGGAVLVGSAVTGGMAMKLDGELEEACPDLDCAPNRHDDVDKLKRLSVASDVMTGVGAAALAAGTVMVVVSLVRGKSESEESNIAVAPVATTDWLGFIVQKEF